MKTMNHRIEYEPEKAWVAPKTSLRKSLAPFLLAALVLSPLSCTLILDTEALIVPCQIDEDCEEGLTCSAGACVPENEDIALDDEENQNDMGDDMPPGALGEGESTNFEDGGSTDDVEEDEESETDPQDSGDSTNDMDDGAAG